MPSAHVFAVDIGSTIIKLAHIGDEGTILEQWFVERDHTLGIARQVEALLATRAHGVTDQEIRVCSSANGGLRVGIVSLSKLFSGASIRNQALAAGANPLFVDTLDDVTGQTHHVDVLLLGGGIDCPDAAPMRDRLERFDTSCYHFGSLVYCGNRYLADAVRQRFGDAIIVDNPLATGLRPANDAVFEVLRRAYLDDLVYKQGISELRGNLANGIRPTPEIVNLGFRQALFKRSSLHLNGPCLMVDIGGATTDLHYTVEMVREDSADRPAPGTSIARYVFTDLGVVASRDSTLAQLRNHPSLFDFLNAIQMDDVRGTYRSIREAEYEPDTTFLALSCLFLALTRFVVGQGPGLPAADLGKMAQIVLTGGASQLLSEQQVVSLLPLIVNTPGNATEILIDRSYRIWLDGICWNESA